MKRNKWSCARLEVTNNVVPGLVCLVTDFEVDSAFATIHQWGRRRYLGLGEFIFK